MAQVDITIQAATDAALTALLMAHGVLLAGEGGVRPAAGVVHSTIGGATLPDGTVLAGRYAFVSVDDEVFGSDRLAQLVVDLQDHTYHGPELRVLLGAGGQSSDGVPYAVSIAQAELALLQVGVTGAMVSAVIDQMPPGLAREQARIRWSRATSVRRNHPLVAAIAQSMDWNEAQVDALFVAASKF